MFVLNRGVAGLTTVLMVLLFSVGAQAATTLKIATLSPEGTGWMIELRKAAKNIRQRTNDEVKLKIYPGGVMGDDKAVLRKLRVGQLHGAAMTSGEYYSLIRISLFTICRWYFAMPKKWTMCGRGWMKS